ncbi:phage holin family protein [Corynebacterium aquatimens]|uniref:Membrane protein n=1 Tax=Corynebacterium aquatimens TaxID=1190508 RepID=A0A931E290_9CORY|nr:phage holin family protein [Corynebacterium aquatimens]MBG6122587.1 putative membrane protein [Corynebacterium aquatimens]WJY64873.1 Membrane protein of unknown function [Corynebacterium aquatimens]
MVRFITDIIVTILALWLVTAIVPGVEVNGGVGSFIWVALVFMFVNAVISPILHTLSLPLKIVTFGIFSLLVNTLLFSITGWLSGLNISGFWAAFFGAIVMTIALWIVEGIFSALGAKNTEATV